MTNEIIIATNSNNIINQKILAQQIMNYSAILKINTFSYWP
jgi:hypothetical protein